MKPVTVSVPLPPTNKTKSLAENGSISPRSHLTLTTVCEEIIALILQRGTLRLREAKDRDAAGHSRRDVQQPVTGNHLLGRSDRVCAHARARCAGDRSWGEAFFGWNVEVFYSKLNCFHTSDQYRY